MVVSLIGYSGIGKTLLAKRLEEDLGWLRVSCDEMIETRLNRELPQGSSTGEERLAAWMGFPWEQESRARQEIYLLLEEQVVDEICDRLERELAQASGKNIVVDTTGSCIYLSHDVLKRLRKFSHVIFLESSLEEEAVLIKRFFSAPKPIIWGNVFQEEAGETHEEAVERCYPKLLQSRRALYQQLADCSLSVEPKLRASISGDMLLKELQRLLPQLTGTPGAP